METYYEIKNSMCYRAVWCMGQDVVIAKHSKEWIISRYLKNIPHAMGLLLLCVRHTLNVKLSSLQLVVKKLCTEIFNFWIQFSKFLLTVQPPRKGKYHDHSCPYWKQNYTDYAITPRPYSNVFTGDSVTVTTLQYLLLKQKICYAVISSYHHPNPIQPLKPLTKSWKWNLVFGQNRFCR